ncbi:CLUMA_CG014851, isoform A [Clunio marinus]|uniref:CLUMA_CG014851, isoform A n=1 Tax=Clunio marinus TaxID=568069 RepID=A0A1J1IP00_9DIPT|nr:CLUMA_CG014851, isoform A [Clunio marinus]
MRAEMTVQSDADYRRDFNVKPYGNNFIDAEMTIQSAVANRRDMKAEGSSTSQLIKVGPVSTKLQCPECKCIIKTKTQTEVSMQTHVIAAMLLP